MAEPDAEATPIAVQRLAFPVTIVASMLVPLIVTVLWIATQFHGLDNRMAAQAHGIDKRLTRIEDAIQSSTRNDDWWVWVDLFRAANPTLNVPEPPGKRRR